MKSLGALLTEAGRKLSRNKTVMAGADKQECFAAIQEARAVHDAWWAGYGPVLRQRHQDYLGRVRANLKRNRERLAEAETALTRHLARAEELRRDIASAWNPEWASAARARLVNQENRVAEVRGTIVKLRQWIDEDDRRLGG